MRLRFAALLAFLVFALLGTVWPASVAAHASLDRTEPVARSAVPVAPTEIRLFFNEPLELRYSELFVYDANLQRREQGALLAIPGDSPGMASAVQPLPEGVYTVTWKANCTPHGHTTSGSFVFSVGNVPPPATVGLGDETTFTLPTPAEVIARWLAILAATALVGALGLRLLVWRPILRDSGLSADGDFARRLSRRLVRLAGGSLLLLIVATVAAVILQAAKIGGRGLGGVNGSLLNDYLLNTRAGGIWLTRLLIPVVALMLLAPLLRAAFRRDGVRRTPDDDDATPTLAPLGPLAFGLILGLAYLLTLSLLSHSAAVSFWVPFNVGMDWLHLIAMAFWVGGILGILLTAPLVSELGAATRPVLGNLVARFSTLGLFSVGILGLTGIYSSWLHVGSFDALFQTDYGRALFGKLVLFAFLILLGALNRFWIGPRLIAQPAAKHRAPGEADPSPRVSQLLLRYFRRIVRTEALLGIAILAIVAVLTGLVPAREALLQSRLPKRTQTVTTGSVKLTLTLGALQPGDNTFDLYLQDDRTGAPITNADRVALRLTHTSMTMGEAEAVAESRGDGHYLANGSYLSMSGEWNLRALVQRPNAPDIDTTFRFPIGSTANLQAQQTKLTAPQLNPLRGVGLLSLVAGAALTIFGVRLFRRGSGWGTAMLMLVPTALVVGGYLIYNGESGEPLVSAPSEPPNPIVADAASIANGGRIFAQNCVVCHGPQGRGDGPQAGTLNPRPPNMTLPHTAYHSDGYMFNSITNGFPGSAMPAWGDTFTEREKWDLVNYLRQFNPLTASGATPPPFTQLPTPGPSVPGGAAPAGTPATPARPSAVGTPTASGGIAPLAPAGAGRLIHSFDGNIWAFDPGTGQGRNITPGLASDAYAGDPALSPDGSTLAFTVIVVPAPNPSAAPTQRVLPGSDLWLMDSDGGNRRQLFSHDRPGVLVEMPYWTPDGKSLVYTYSAPILGPDGRYTGSIRELQRLDVATGQRSTLVKDGEDVAFSYAGGATPFAYVLTDPATFQQSLWVADLNGGNARRIVGPEQKFQTVNSPRFTPDGTRIIFAASAPFTAGDQSPPAEQRAPARFFRWLFAPFIPQSVAAHGPPADLWSIALDGSGLRQLTTLNGDDPQPAFSPDGQQLAFLTGNGLFLANLDGTNARRISDRGSLSSLVWSPR